MGITALARSGQTILVAEATIRLYRGLEQSMVRRCHGGRPTKQATPSAERLFALLMFFSKSVIDRNLDNMEEQYAGSASFLTSSMHQVNGDKTNTILITTAQFRRLNKTDLTVNFGNDKQGSSKVERLLGLQLPKNLKFGEYIQNNEKSLLYI